MENPQFVFATISIVCLLFGGIPLLSSKAAAWYVRSTIRGRAAAAALGEERALRLIRFGISPVVVVAGVAAGAYAIALATGAA